MYIALFIALVAFLNSASAYFFSKVSYKKLSFGFAILLVVMAIGIFVVDYLDSRNSPIITLTTIETEGPKGSILLRVGIQNDGNPPFGDLSVIVTDPNVLLDSLKSMVRENDKNGVIGQSVSISPKKQLLGTLPGKNSTDAYTRLISRKELLEGVTFQVLLNWDNASLLYNFSLKDTLGRINVFKPQIRSKDGEINPKGYFQHYGYYENAKSPILKLESIYY